MPGLEQSIEIWEQRYTRARVQLHVHALVIPGVGTDEDMLCDDQEDQASRRDIEAERTGCRWPLRPSSILDRFTRALLILAVVD